MRKILNNNVVLVLLAIMFNSLCYAQKDGDPIVIGHYKTIQSEILQEERQLQVTLPESYSKSDKAYPVVYLFYGNRIMLYYTETVSIFSNLGGDGVIPECILIGVGNVDRYRDYSFEDWYGNPSEMDKFYKCFTHEIIPYVESNYRTKDFRIAITPQASSSFLMYTHFKSPDLFQLGISNNPFRWPGSKKHITRLLNESQLEPKRKITYSI